MKPTKSQADFVEKVARWWEAVAGSRTAGRILGWLMICEPVHQSSNDLVNALSASAGSVSTQIRQLEGFGLIDRVTFPGDRATYYALKPDAWTSRMWDEQQRLGGMVELARAAADVLPGERPDRITDLGRIAEFLLAEWPALMERLSEHIAKEQVT